MRKRTATSPLRTASYCIQDLLSAIRLSKLFAVEKTPISNASLFLEGDGAFRRPISISRLRSLEVGNPFAMIDITSNPPFSLTSLTNHGSSFCTLGENTYRSDQIFPDYDPKAQSTYIIILFQIAHIYLSICKRCFMPSIHSHMESLYASPQ